MDATDKTKQALRMKMNPSADNLLLKPFSMGWTREVVMRVVKKSGAPNCDIYYLSPSKKRIRSLTEIKNLLTDGLSAEHFSFKKMPLGLGPDMETIRSAKAKGGKLEKNKEKTEKAQGALRKTERQNNLKKDKEEEKVKEHEEITNEKMNEEQPMETDNKQIVEENHKIEEVANEKIEEIAKDNQKTEDMAKNNQKADEGKKNLKEERKTQRKKTEDKIPKQTNNVNNKKKTKRKLPNATAPLTSVRLRKKILKKMMNARQTKKVNVVASNKILKKIVVNNVKTPKKKLLKKKVKKEISLKSKNNAKVKSKNEKAVVKNSAVNTKSEAVNETEESEADKKAPARDVKSIVKKNIGKYREMREKQKLGAIKGHIQKMNKSASVTSTSIASTSKMRSEPISKKKFLYLKPLEKGWRRELVYRSNCAKAGQMADVYYFHPNGKKFRSCREISENLTPGLSIECFTFRKEALGCGEPLEVVRNARFTQKN